MKVIDHVGNSLIKGRLLRWQRVDPTPLDMYVKVLDVVPPTKDMPGNVTLSLTFGIAPISKKDNERGAVQFKEFTTVFDPEDELRTEVALAKAMKEDYGILTK
jgi:hypothetical protein